MILFHPASTWHDAFDTRAYMQQETDRMVAPAIEALAGKCSDWVELNVVIQSIREVSLEAQIVLLLPVTAAYKAPVTLHLLKNCEPLQIHAHRNEGDPLLWFTSNSTIAGRLLCQEEGLPIRVVAPLRPDPTVNHLDRVLSAFRLGLGHDIRCRMMADIPLGFSHEWLIRPSDYLQCVSEEIYANRPRT